MSPSCPRWSSGLGARVDENGDAIIVDATDLDSYEAPYELVARMRASIAVLGPLVARFGRAHVAMPGGCNIGSRKVDMHISGLQALGVEFSFEHGYIDATAPGGCTALTSPSSSRAWAPRRTCSWRRCSRRARHVIENAAREPEIADLAADAREMGARIEGAGTSTITSRESTR
jgi:UDP-N-acetylglucosamine 1-carboxyvinyltransferase